MSSFSGSHGVMVHNCMLILHPIQAQVNREQSEFLVCERISLNYI